MFQNSLNYLTILGAGMLTLGNLSSDDPQILEATVKTLSPRDVCSRDLCTPDENEEKHTNALSKIIAIAARLKCILITNV
jgi:hypothetical protein